MPNGIGYKKEGIRMNEKNARKKILRRSLVMIMLISIFAGMINFIAEKSDATPTYQFWVGDYSWIDISTNGTATGLNGDDEYTNIPLGFDFNFYGNTYPEGTNLYIGTNGMMSFSSTGMTYYDNVQIPNTAVPNNLIAVVWDDLYGFPTNNANVYYKTFGTSPNRYMVIQWYHWSWIGDSDSDTIEFEVILYENRTIRMQYNDMYSNHGRDNGADATSGIENSGGTSGIQYSYNNAILTAGKSVWYFADTIPPTSSVNPISPYWQTTSSISITATANDNVGVNRVVLYYRYSSDNVNWSDWFLYSTDTSFPYSWSFNFPTGEGYYQFYSRAMDTSSNWESASTTADASCAYFRRLSYINAISQYWHTKSPLTINASGGGDVVKIELWYRHSSNNINWTDWISFGTDNSSPYTWSFNFPTGEGYYQFYSRGTDSANNSDPAPTKDTGGEVAIGYDFTQPTSSVNPISPYWQKNYSLTITANATDNLGVDRVDLWYRNSTDNNIWSNWTLFNTDYYSPYKWYFNFPTGEGYYQFYTRATDIAGNYESVPTIPDASIGYDITLPKSYVNSISPYWQKTSPLTITGEAVENLKVASVELWYRHSTDNFTWSDWKLFDTDTSSPWYFSFNFPNNAVYYQFYSRAKDEANNYEPAPTIGDALSGYIPLLIIGDFVISTPITVENKTTILNGNMIINNRGNLTFKNVVWKMNLTSDGKYGITVNSGGKFSILENSKITAVNSSNEFKFLVDDGAKFEMRNSELSECGYEEGNYGEAGLTIKTNNSIIQNNKFYSNYYGIYIYYSNKNNIRGNNIYSNQYGIYVYSSPNNILKDNILSNNIYNFGVYGDSISQYSQNIDRTNKINGKPIHYIQNKKDLVFDKSKEIGYLALISCNNITIKDGDFKNNIQGILIINTTDLIVENNKFYFNKDGIYSYNSNKIQLTKNKIYNNTDGIIFISSCSNQIRECDMYNNTNSVFLDRSNTNVFIKNNIYKNNGNGIYIYNSNDNTIETSNIYSNSKNGIYLYYSEQNHIIENKIYSNNEGGILFEQSSNNKIIRNNIYSNKYNGASFNSCNFNRIEGNNIYSNGRNGSYFYNSLYNPISNNKIYSNEEGGIYFVFSVCNQIIYNEISKNKYGFYLMSSTDNKIYLNDFIDNKNQEYDDGYNSWNSSLYGNYWSNHPNVDKNGDGFVDIPYMIAGGENQDSRPLTKKATKEEEEVKKSLWQSILSIDYIYLLTSIGLIVLIIIGILTSIFISGLVRKKKEIIRPKEKEMEKQKKKVEIKKKEEEYLEEVKK